MCSYSSMTKKIGTRRLIDSDVMCTSRSVKLSYEILFEFSVTCHFNQGVDRRGGMCE